MCAHSTSSEHAVADSCLFSLAVSVVPTTTAVLAPLRRRSIDPLLLTPLTKLQHLDLDSTPPAGGSKGAAVLLAVLPRLQHLTHLDLCDCLITAAAPAAAYSALTASHKLAYLDISGAEPPADAWRHLLPAKRPLTALQRLHLAGVYEASTEGLSDKQLQHLVQACPKLENLQCWLQPTVLPEALLELTALTGLALQGVTEEVADSVLLQLTALQDLHIVPDSSIDDAGMLRLTALTKLSQLGVHHDACSPEFCEQYSALAVKDGEDFVLVFDTEVSVSVLWLGCLDGEQWMLGGWSFMSSTAHWLRRMERTLCLCLTQR